MRERISIKLCRFDLRLRFRLVKYKKGRTGCPAFRALTSRHYRRSLIRRGLDGVGRQVFRAQREVVADDPEDLVVVEVGRPDLALGVLLLLLFLLGLLLLGGFLVVVVGEVLGLELGLVERDRVTGLAVEELLDPLGLLLELGV